MKSFDVYLQRAQAPKWKAHYMNYATMKAKLTMFARRRRKLQRGDIEWSTVVGTYPDPSNNSNSTSSDAFVDESVMFGYRLQDISQEFSAGVAKVTAGGGESREERLSRMEHDEFKGALQKQLEGASRWYQTRWFELQSATFEKEEDEEESILDLYGFAVVNICVLRQLICRYNAHVRMYDGTMLISEWEICQPPTPSEKSEPMNSSAMFTKAASAFFESSPKGSRSSFFSRAETDHSVSSSVKSCDFSLNTVIPCLLTSLDPLQDRMMTMPSYWMMDSGAEFKSIRSNASTGTEKPTDFRARADELESILDETSWKQETLHAPNRTERIMQMLRGFWIMGTAQMGIVMEPKFLYAQIRGYKKEMKALAKWRERPLNVPSGGDDDEDSTDTTGTMDPANVWPLVLNLVSCFLFMMNNYIIEPSSAYYANALGSNDALSGMMIGMAPWFALTSAVGYSVWTNTSYKQPILFSGVLMVIGNFMYGAAYSYQSMTVCLIGRGISGFGAPRIINRRYVADATPFKLRTMSSAAFALTTALGAASGPGFAILLDMVPEFEFYVPLVGMQTFNGMTGPGFVMSFLWLLFTITILVSFGEPNRSGLEELKQREAAAKAKEAALQVASTGDDAREALKPSNSEDDTAMISDDEDDKDRRMSQGNVSVLTMGSFGEKEMEESGYSKHSPLYCIKNMTRATALCMALIYMKRIALESIVGSTSVITKNRYAWSIRNVGTLHLVNGLIVIPVSVFAGWLSQYREDRYLAMWFMGITAVGLLVMIDPTDLVDTESSDTYNYDLPMSVGPVQYIVGSLIAFSGVEACESFVASLMSKCVPSALAVGTFNSGLLATLVGTGGRASGDLFITAMGLISIRNLLNLLIIPGLVLMILSMLLLWKNYKIVAV